MICRTYPECVIVCSYYLFFIKLNRHNSLQKKLEATQRDDIQIFKTGGGLRIIFNTGMYELIKYSADKYYASKECKRIPVQDKQDNLVETKFKMKSEKQDLYTLNMYHTKCTCLVKGRQPRKIYLAF